MYNEWGLRVSPVELLFARLNKSTNRNGNKIIPYKSWQDLTLNLGVIYVRGTRGFTRNRNQHYISYTYNCSMDPYRSKHLKLASRMLLTEYLIVKSFSVYFHCICQSNGRATTHLPPIRVPSAKRASRK